MMVAGQERSTRDEIINHIAMLVAQPLAARTNAEQILDYISEDVIPLLISRPRGCADID